MLIIPTIPSVFPTNARSHLLGSAHIRNVYLIATKRVQTEQAYQESLPESTGGSLVAASEI